MVVFDYLSFPVSSSPTVLIGTANIPYGSTDGVNRSIQINVPIGFYFRVQNLYVANGMTITATINPITSANVYKNGTLIGTVSNVGGSFTTATTKKFTLGSTIVGTIFFNSYYGNAVFAYTPTTLPTFNNTDVYTFYITYSYSMSSTSSNTLTASGANSIKYGILTNTSTSTSSFNQMSYFTGYGDTTGYAAYSIFTPFSTSTNWSVTNQGYVPPIDYSLWTGLYQMAALYANSAYFTSNINLKNMGNTNTIAWLDTDANGGGTIGTWYASLSSLAMTFYVNSTKLTNGFIFTGGNVTISNDLRIPSTSVVNFGYNTTKEANAGKIGYQTFSGNCLDIVGAGTGVPRKTQFYDYVGIGTTPSYPLHVTSSGGAVTVGSYFYYYNGFSTSPTTSSGVSIYASSMIVGGGIGAISDIRIKKNVKRLNSQESLQKIRNIKPSTFEYVDIVENNSTCKNGFIAQELIEVIDDAVKMIKNTIPNINDFADINGNIVTLRKSSTSSFNINPTAKELSIILYDENDLIYETNVVKIIDDKTFQTSTIFTNKVLFVKGQQVDDFLVIDKNVIFTYVTSAVQELDSIIQSQDNEIKNLKLQMQQVLLKLNL